MSGGKKSGASRPLDPLAIQHQTLLNVNDISMWANDNGVMERRLSDSAAGVIFPRGTTSVVYTAGLVWGGRVNDGNSPFVRVGGTTTVSSMQSGRIVRPGVAENPNNADVRIYRIRKDWNTADLRNDASDVLAIAPALISPSHMQAVRDQYKKDWLEWPWQKGAPYYERNGIPGYQPNPDGVRDSTSDEPGLAQADQVLWYVMNDLDPPSPADLLFGPPIGLEIQVTCWAFSGIPDLRNVAYQRYRFIYKGTETTANTATIDQMRIAKWSDADIGTYDDDFAGSDSTKGLVFVYNSTPTDIEFQKVHSIPPVVGYDMVQGPRRARAGSTALFDLQKVSGYENVPVSTISYFTEESRTADQGGTSSWWDILRGRDPQRGGSCLIDYLTGQCTSFELSGDPVTFRGWVDGRKDAAGDRRVMLASGPFTMALGDTQEVVISLMSARGKDHRDGVTLLKSIDGAAQDALNLSFDFPEPIPATPLRIVELDKKLILDWESDTTQARLIEEYSSRGYAFENYALYQLPYADSPMEDAVPLPSFDITMPRFLSITHDYVRNKPLVNGTRYYYMVNAVMSTFDPTFSKHRFETTPKVYTATPHSPNPGIVYPYTEEDILTGVQDVVGNNDAKVRIKYFDPTRPDGHSYKFIFRRSSNPLIDIETKARWDLTDVTTGDTLLRSIRMDTIPQRVITRGFLVEALSPLYGIRNVYEVMHNNQPVREVVFNQPNTAGNVVVVGDSLQIESIEGGNALDADIEFRFTGDSSWTLIMGTTPARSRWVRVPFTAWQVGILGRDTLNRQVYTIVTNTGGDSVWRPTVLLDRSVNGKTLQVFYPVTVVSDSMQIDLSYVGGTYDDSIPYRTPFEQGRIRGFLWINGRTDGNGRNALWRVYIGDPDEDGTAAPPGTIIRFERHRVVRNGDEKIFTPEKIVMTDIEAAKREVDLVNVFPNPYYGLNARELDRFNRFVTFNHLPHVATIRLFTLSGDLVRIITKNSPDQFATWDLNNLNGLPVGGGLYFAHIEMKDLAGNDLGTKILKLMIVHEKTFLEGR